MIAADPTFDLLRRLDDPAAWEHIDRGICVFREHAARHYNPETKQDDIEVVYDRPKLERYLGRLQDLQSNFGTCPLVILGHTKKKSEADEQDQPEPVGYWANPRLVEWGPKKLCAIVMDRFILPGKWEEAKKYPYRSPEFYPEEYEKYFPGEIQPEDLGAITAVALLKTPPKLDMGTTLYQQCLPLCYGRFDDLDQPMTDPTVMPGVPDEDANTRQQNGDTEFEGRFKTCMSRCFPKFERYHQDVMSKYEGLQSPGPGNLLPGDKRQPYKTTMSATVETVTPAPATPPPTLAATATGDEVRQLRTQMETLQVQYERGRAEDKAENVKLRAELAVVQHEKTLAQYERDMQPLTAIYQFDFPKHMARCKDASGVPIPKAQFDDMLSNIKENYVRLPISDAGSPIGTVGGQPIIPDSKLTPKADPKDPRSQVTAADIMPLALYTRAQQEKSPGKSEDDCLREYVKAKAERAMPVAA